MKKNSVSIIIFFLLIPLTAFASGAYVLPALLIDFFVFLIIVFAIIRLQIKWIGKAILFLTYLLSIYVMLYLIDQVNYLHNLTWINIGSALFPPAVVYLTYLGVNRKFKKARG